MPWDDSRCPVGNRRLSTVMQEGATVCDMSGFLFDWLPAATRSQAWDQINGCRGKSQDPGAAVSLSVIAFG